MMLRRIALCAGMVLLSGAAGAQTVNRYTENQSGAGLLALGYPVPMPVESLTPVDGFRDYASIDARLRGLDLDSDQVEGHDVGLSRAGRTIRAYLVSDPDAVDVEGRAESAFFINAGIHAREWGTPEISTYMVERMVAGGSDQGLVRYLLDNARLVIIPVLNVDGFLQTQRYADRAVIGADPRQPSSWPRDGRMRRKNMVGVDENLDTFGDHLFGVDLNRNHPPFWGTVTNGGQLTNTRDLTYRGAAAQSEPESQAVLSAAALAPVSRLRLGIDVHSFSQVFFSSNTSRSRLNQIQFNLLNTLGLHHGSLPTATGEPNGKFYSDIPDPPNSGIGALAEYFAYNWLVPAWTLEIEPGNGEGSEYGGTGVSHSGFVLPNSQVRRVREAWAETHLVAFYIMSGPAHLARVRVRSAADGALLLERRWQYNPQTQQRSLQVDQFAPLLAGQDVVLELSFSKPMRRRVNGEAGVFPGVTGTAVAPSLSILGSGGARSSIDTQAGYWGGEDQRLRYVDDTFIQPLTLPAGSNALQLEVDVSDMAGRKLDSDPSTPVDWVAGAWSNLEDSSGTQGDVGGVDHTGANFDLVRTVAPTGVSVSALPPLVGEGDALGIRLTRSAQNAQGSVLLRGRVHDQDTIELSWADGESGEKVLSLPVGEDIEVQGDRTINFTVLAVVDGLEQPFDSGSAKLLDNDRVGQSVVRSRADPYLDLARLANAETSQRELVADGGREYRTPSNALTFCQQYELRAPMRVFGNRSRWLPGDSACTVALASGQGGIELRDMLLDGRKPEGTRIPLISGVGPDLSTQRVDMRDAGGYAISTQGALTLKASAVVDSELGSAGRSSPITLIESSSAEIRDSSSIDISASSEVQLQDSLFGFSGTATATIRGLSTAGGYSDEFRIRGNTLLSGSLHLSDPTPVLGAQPVCSNVQSNGFNIALTSHCFQPTATDAVGVAVGDSTRTGADLAYKLPTGQAVDFGGNCSPVDQRGAPRPQTLVAGAEPRCDAGAVELGVNPWRGFWIPSRSGHGIDLQTRDNVLFLLWYTYNDQGEPTAYQAAAPLTGLNWSARLKLASRNMQTGQVSLAEVGDISIVFDSDVAARLSWKFDTRSSGGSEAISAFAFASGEPRVETTGTWFPPSVDGYGASITRRGDVTAIAVYYYDASGRLRWALGNASASDAARFEMSSYSGFCPDCSNQTMPVQLRPAGSVDLHMLTPLRLRLDASLSYPGTEGGVWEVNALDLVPISDPVDNRDAAAQSATAN